MLRQQYAEQVYEKMLPMLDNNTRKTFTESFSGTIHSSPSRAVLNEAEIKSVSNALLASLGVSSMGMPPAYRGCQAFVRTCIAFLAENYDANAILKDRTPIPELQLGPDLYSIGLLACAAHANPITSGKKPQTPWNAFQMIKPSNRDPSVNENLSAHYFHELVRIASDYKDPHEEEDFIKTCVEPLCALAGRKFPRSSKYQWDEIDSEISNLQTEILRRWGYRNIEYDLLDCLCIDALCRSVKEEDCPSIAKHYVTEIERIVEEKERL